VKKTCCITAVLVAAVAGLCGYFYVGEVEYSTNGFYADCGMVAAGRNSEWQYGNKPGHLTLVLARGRPHSRITTAHGWSERVSVEFTSKPVAGTIDIRDGKVRFGFASYRDRTQWSLGDKGIHGSLQIESVGETRILASCDLTIDAFASPRVVRPEFQHREVSFRGRFTFHLEKYPESTIAGFGNPFPK